MINQESKSKDLTEPTGSWANELQAIEILRTYLIIHEIIKTNLENSRGEPCDVT